MLGDPAAYSPINGFAYSVQVSDPDFNGGMVNYTVSADLDLAASGTQNTKTFTGPGGSTTITYTPPAAFKPRSDSFVLHRCLTAPNRERSP